MHLNMNFVTRQYTIVTVLWYLSGSLSVSLFESQRFLELISAAENQLKVYTYKNTAVQYEFECPFQFRAERVIPNYFKFHQSTLDPLDADLFLVEHDFTCMFNVGNILFPNVSSISWKTKHIFRKHLRPIFSNVIYNYPYFNRTKGNDHIVVLTVDLGPYCQYFEGFIRNIFSQISNVTFLLNFGYDGYTPKPCLRPPGKDIVIPQYHEWGPSSHETTNKKPRMYDSYFYGSYKNRYVCSSNIRRVLEDLGSIPHLRLFNSNQSKWSKESMKPKVSDSYFSLCPAGYSPWSLRLYDAIQHNSVPVILANGIIEPFEKFLSWESFTVKLDTDSINSTDLSWLEKMHKHGRLHRTKKTNRGRKKTDKNMMLVSNHGEYLEKKLKYVREASLWLHWQTSSKTSVWKLLILELWCKTKHAINEPICQTNASRIAYQSYW